MCKYCKGTKKILLLNSYVECLECKNAIADSNKEYKTEDWLKRYDCESCGAPCEYDLCDKCEKPFVFCKWCSKPYTDCQGQCQKALMTKAMDKVMKDKYKYNCTF